MPRTLRLEYPGAVYHVLNRGNYRSDIFREDGARLAFLACLGEACERTGWVVHAWCVMSNHYHLAVETPEPNLVAGMQWLQGTFATRFNRYRRETGHLFQGRYKSLIVDPSEALGPLCHYIHLNPVRAGLMGVEELVDWPWTSLRWLCEPHRRLSWFHPGAALGHAGGLSDAPAGRRKYVEYLGWLSANAEQQRAMRFERMSRGWVLGTAEFRADLVAEHREAAALLNDGYSDAGERREEVLALRLKQLLSAVGKGEKDLRSQPKSAPWKVALAAEMKARTTATNSWLARALHMGSPFRVSRLTSAARPQPAKDAKQDRRRAKDIA